MADKITKEARSKVMAAVRSKGGRTTEKRLRGILMALRFRGWKLNPPTVFGHPDATFPARKIAIFVDGCFWHGCPQCYRAPKSNIPFWKAKIERNRKRDWNVKRELRKQGWVVLRVWECRLKDAPKISRRIQTAMMSKTKLTSASTTAKAT